MSAADHCSKASSMRFGSPVSRISRMVAGDTMPGEARLEVEEPSPAGFMGV